MLHWNLVQWVCFVFLWVSLTHGSMAILGKILGGRSCIYALVAVIINPLIAAQIITINVPVLTGASIFVPLLVDIQEKNSLGRAVIAMAIPVLVVAMIIENPKILAPFGFLLALIIGW